MKEINPKNHQWNTWEKVQTPHWASVENLELHKSTTLSNRWTPDTMQSDLSVWHWNAKMKQILLYEQQWNNEGNKNLHQSATMVYLEHNR